MPQLFTLVPSVIRAVRMGFFQLKPPSSLPKNRCVLEAIAVHPDHQGEGIGSRLLDEVHQLCHRDETTDGICLYTGSEQNVALYKRFGYTLTATVEGKAFRAYHMYLKKIQEELPSKES